MTDLEPNRRFSSFQETSESTPYDGGDDVDVTNKDDFVLNQYGVKVRGAKKAQAKKHSDEDEIQFSSNIG